MDSGVASAASLLLRCVIGGEAGGDTAALARIRVIGCDIVIVMQRHTGPRCKAPHVVQQLGGGRAGGSANSSSSSSVSSHCCIPLPPAPFSNHGGVSISAASAISCADRHRASAAAGCRNHGSTSPMASIANDAVHRMLCAGERRGETGTSHGGSCRPSIGAQALQKTQRRPQRRSGAARTSEIPVATRQSRVRHAHLGQRRSRRIGPPLPWTTNTEARRGGRARLTCSTRSPASRCLRRTSSS